jgi:alpha-beta hydrolase superfamily lysophospholipase
VTELRIESDEGLIIRATLDVPERAQAFVVIVHGFKGFRQWGFFPWLSEQLAACRIAVCRFDMSRNGVADNPERFERLDLFADDTYSTQLADLRRVVDHCRSLPPLRLLPLFLLGHSRGGAISLLSARDLAPIRGIITWSSIASVDRWGQDAKRQWRRDGYFDVVNARTHEIMRMSTAILDDYETNVARLDVAAAAAALDLPLLVLHGGRDESVAPMEGSMLASQARDASLVMIESATHTYNAIHPLVHIPRELAIAARVSAHFVEAYA